LGFPKRETQSQKELKKSVLLYQKLKMATPFLVLKTLTGFDFQFTEVSSHFCELVLS
jgi:hypothetical protein